MNTLLKIIAYIIIIPLFTTWLLFCVLLALLGSILPKKDISINLNEVEEEETICKVLNRKGLMSDEDYSFEINEVAIMYDETTFKGYLFILNPIIFIFNQTNFMDNFIAFLAHKWMEIHHFEKTHKQEAKTFFSLIANTSVSIAKGTGNFLYRF